MKDIRHLVRAGLLFLLVFIGFLIARQIMIPADFGKLGHFRAGAIDDIAAPTPQYAGQQACGECHAEAAKSKAGGRHRSISCESCHGPLYAHSQKPRAVKAFKPSKEGRDFCGRCHFKNASRPAAFPQVDPEGHNTGAPCMGCHDRHSPKL